MKYIAAYALLALNKDKVTSDDMANLLTSMGVEVDQKPIDLIVNSLKGMSTSEAVELGLGKLSNMSLGGGNGNVQVVDVEEDKTSEVSEEDADVSMGDLFGSD